MPETYSLYYQWHSLLYPLQLAFTVWMLVDAYRRGVESYWYFVIFIFQPVGSWVYFFLFKVNDLKSERNWLGGLFHRKTPLPELRRRAERLGTVANRLELGSRLVENGDFAEAVPHLQAVLSHEPEHCQALFSLASAQRGLGQFDQAIPNLRKILKRHPTWGNYGAWHMLINVYGAAGNPDEALASCRELARVAPSLQHVCMLAERLLDAGEKEEARKLLERSLEDYRYMTGIARRVARPWVGKTKQLLRQVS
jgi:hypothetical protein